MTKLEAAVVQLASFLSRMKVPYMIIGGYANLFWGRPRLTQDLDVTVFMDDADIQRLADGLSAEFAILPKDPASFVKETRVLPIATHEGVRVDLIIAGLPYEQTAIERARTVAVAGHPVHVCTPEDLIIHKVISGRPRDREDVQGVIARQGKALDRSYLDPIVRELSIALDRPDVWEFYEQAMVANT